VVPRRFLHDPALAQLHCIPSHAMVASCMYAGTNHGKTPSASRAHFCMEWHLRTLRIPLFMHWPSGCLPMKPCGRVWAISTPFTVHSWFSAASCSPGQR
jgi:hypothetical protein